MLANLTFVTSLVALDITLWLAFYLFARGFPNRITMRAVLSLLAISLFFLGTYNNFFFQGASTAGTLRAILLIISMTCWYGVTFQLLSPAHQEKFRRMELGLYILSTASIILLLVTKTAFAREQGNELYVVQLEKSPAYVVYGFTQVAISAGLIFNLLVDKRIRHTAQGRFFLFASIFPTLAVIYGMVALVLTDPPMPRVIQDFFVFCGVFLLGISVARHQTLIERRTIFQDFPTAGLAMLVLMSVYVYISLQIGLSTRFLGFVTAFAIITHSAYDLVREFLERLRLRNESRFRKQIRLMESNALSENKFQRYLEDGLEQLCKTLDTSSGMIAVWREDKFIVTAGRHSAELGSDIPNEVVVQEELFRSKDKIVNIEWLASSFEGQKQIALVGVGQSGKKLEYSAGELDLLMEFADHVGTITSIGKLLPHTNEQILLLVEEANSHSLEMASAAGNMLEDLTSNPEEDFIKVVEEGLRKYSDTTILGQSPLANLMGVDGSTHLERGRQVQKVLYKAIETLRPAESRPPEPLPRIWYNYVVLHDAYVKGVINREVMSRLYISEGTFNRTRRNAVKGVAKWLLEENKR